MCQETRSHTTHVLHFIFKFILKYIILLCPACLWAYLWTRPIFAWIYLFLTSSPAVLLPISQFYSNTSKNCASQFLVGWVLGYLAAQPGGPAERSGPPLPTVCLHSSWIRSQEEIYFRFSLNFVLNWHLTPVLLIHPRKVCVGSSWVRSTFLWFGITPL